MITNYMISAWRNMAGKNKLYSFINILGLAFGLAVALLIWVWVYDEVNFNKSFRNYDRLVQLYHHITFGDEVMTLNDVPAPIGEALKSITEFEDVVITTTPEKKIISVGENVLTETALFVEPRFLDMFSVHFLNKTKGILNDIHSVAISQTFASRLFSDDPVGKLIKVDNQDLLKVTAVFEDFPLNSTFAEVKMLFPMAYWFSKDEKRRYQQNNWEDYSFQCYALLQKSHNLDELNTKVKHLLFKNVSADGKSLKPEGFLFPMKKWHLWTEFKNGINIGGQIKFVWMFSTIGVFVLLLACVNYTNLSTARSETRAKEIGVRKVMGSVRLQLIIQFLSESFLLVSIAYVLALMIAWFSLPWFSRLGGKDLQIPWPHDGFLILSCSFLVVTALVAGIYPSLYLSGLKPVAVLKGQFKISRLGIAPMKFLVVLQFVTSIVLIISTAIVFQQVQFAKDRPVGFDREGIIHIRLTTEALAKSDYNLLRHELLSTGVVDNMAFSDFPITGAMAADASLTWEGKDPAQTPLFAMNSCSHDFPKTSGFHFVQGRDFTREQASDSSAVIVNELAAALIGDPVLGKKIQFGHGKEREIIGVIKDQVRWTPFVKQSPHLYYVNYAARGYLTVRLSSKTNIHEAIQKVEKVIKRIDPGFPFEYKFVDDDYARLFHSEETIGKLAAIFSALAIFISCIGIFGLATFSVAQRTKEIGIRKVLGASVFSVWKILSKDFMNLVLMAILLATPLSYFLADRWLQQYDYRISISWENFVFAAVLIVLLTLVTVSHRTLKAAYKNPAESLKTE